ncbi:MAG TPA: hypothetical protein GXX38_03890 [Clostridia bacterium]|jgi:Fe2+ or Zn2+ uptake regulation protein|nr:hypothetical protein [Clostridia bacterium]
MNKTPKKISITKKNKKLRHSYKRALIIDVLRKIKQNNPNVQLTTKEIYELVKKEGIKVGLSTVYRNVKILEELGLVNRIKKSPSDPICYKLNSFLLKPTYSQKPSSEFNSFQVPRKIES